MKKKIIALILAAVTAISLMGCGNTNTNTQEAAETQDQTAAEGSAEADTGAEETANGENTYRYTFVSPLVSHEYWIDVEEGFRQVPRSRAWMWQCLEIPRLMWMPW